MSKNSNPLLQRGKRIGFIEACWHHDIVEQARAWVYRERRWSVICKRYIPIYEKLLGTTLAKLTAQEYGSD